MAGVCNLCGDGIRVVLENTQPTIRELEVLHEAIMVQGRLLGCAKNRETCEPLRKIERAKLKIEKEILRS